jgi:hypothetical protein
LLQNGCDCKATKETTAHSVLDAQSVIVANLALNCLSHLFSWVPMLTSREYPSLLFENIFKFAMLGCQTFGVSASVEAVSSQNQLGEIAMSCINELLAKNQVPGDCEEFLLTLFSQTYTLLQCLTENSGFGINQLSPRY